MLAYTSMWAPLKNQYRWAGIALALVLPFVGALELGHSKWDLKRCTMEHAQSYHREWVSSGVTGMGDRFVDWSTRKGRGDKGVLRCVRENSTMALVGMCIEPDEAIPKQAKLLVEAVSYRADCLQRGDISRIVTAITGDFAPVCVEPVLYRLRIYSPVAYLSLLLEQA